MAAVHYLSVTLESFGECINCGTPIYGSQQLKKQLLANHKTFYCINGHAQHFVGETEEARLKKKLEQVERERDAARARELMAKNNERSARHSAAISKGKLRAQLERIKNGVCPCCKRSFANVRRHMATKHPHVLEKLDAVKDGES